jgi:signal peptidase I
MIEDEKNIPPVSDPDKKPVHSPDSSRVTEDSDLAAPVAKGGKKTETKKTKGEGEGIISAVLWAAVIALIVRSLLFEPFSIPSGSMFPTLKIGDYLFVQKYAYGYSKYSFPLALIDFEGRVMESYPERGDIVVFRKPQQESIDYIKRVIGLPGDEIQMTAGKLYINDERVPRDFVGIETIKEGSVRQAYQKYIESLPDGPDHYIYEISDNEALDATPKFVIPDGYFFAMGDNRDASLDSRAVNSVGFVPVENLIGRASFFFFSMEPIGPVCHKTGTLASVRRVGCKLVKIPTHIRYSRIFRPVQNMMHEEK